MYSKSRERNNVNWQFDISSHRLPPESYSGHILLEYTGSFYGEHSFGEAACGGSCGEYVSKA